MIGIRPELATANESHSKGFSHCLRAGLKNKRNNIAPAG
jgi:hypothetical protein